LHVRRSAFGPVPDAEQGEDDRQTQAADRTVDDGATPYEPEPGKR
jgi:hypothetical protein